MALSLLINKCWRFSMKNYICHLFITFLLLSTLVSCAGKTGNGDDGVVNNPPATAEIELDNARQVDKRIYLDSFRYRQLYAYDDGRSSATLTERTTLTMSENDIKVYVKVDDADFSRVDGYSINTSDQPWAQMDFISQTSGERVKICVQIQAQSFTINQAGESEISLRKKAIYTVLDPNISCVGVRTDNVSVFDGILSNYLVVDGSTTINGETKNDIKARKSGQPTIRVGLKVEFSFLVD